MVLIHCNNNKKKNLEKRPEKKSQVRQTKGIPQKKK